MSAGKSIHKVTEGTDDNLHTNKHTATKSTSGSNKRPKAKSSSGRRAAAHLDHTYATKKSAKKRRHDLEINRLKELFPYCIVWTPLPVVSWFIPFIGHTGLANSKGIIYDYSDDFNVSVNNLAFGSPTKFYQLDPRLIPGGAENWDRTIKQAADFYLHNSRYNCLFTNCQQYIAYVLNKVGYAGREDYTQLEVWSEITFYSEYSDQNGCLRQWWPFTAVVITTIIILIIIFNI